METIDYIFRIAFHAGITPEKHWKILDFGCGQGTLVLSLRQRGYEAYGFDIRNYLSESCQNEPWFSFSNDRREGYRLKDPFALPYASESLDMILSHEVFEHIMDPEPVLREFARVLRPGGVSINLYPPRLTPVEGHIHVPYGHLLVYPWYYKLWAALGLRTKKQKENGLTASQVAKENENYIRTCTHYTPNPIMLHMAGKYFSEARFDQYANLTGFMEHLEARMAHYPMWIVTRLIVRAVRTMTRSSYGRAIWKALCRDIPPSRWLLENFVPGTCLILRK